MIEFANVEIGYSSSIINVGKLRLYQGKLYTLIGKNGIGKSTFIKSVLGWLKPLKGTITINKHNINGIKLKDRAKLIAYVGTGFDGIENMKVFDYIALGRSPYTNFIGTYSEKDLTETNEVIHFLKIAYTYTIIIHKFPLFVEVKVNIKSKI